jgi:hypothetical protein
MKNPIPSSPLLTLAVEPKDGVSTQQLLAQFHPIMKSLGFGNFDKEAQQRFIASKAGKGIFGSDLFVFAEVSNSNLVINIDGFSILGQKAVEVQLNQIKKEYELRGNSVANILGPDYKTALIGNFLYTALPVYASAFLVMLLMWWATDDPRPRGGFNVFLYATMFAVGGKTKYWVHQRRKNRPIWQGILILLLTVPVILAAIGMIFWAISEFG